MREEKGIGRRRGEKSRQDGGEGRGEGRGQRVTR